jgi:3-phosphoshikimate 1-carboxyvinyltransferase
MMPNNAHEAMPLSDVVLTIPGDKSLSHRALLFSALLGGPSTIAGLLPSADVNATRRCMSQLGVGIEPLPDGRIQITPPVDGFTEPDDVLMVDNSGTSIRLLAGLLSATPFPVILTGDAAIRRRPMGRVIAPLQQMGAAITGRAGNTLAPLVIQPAPLGLQGVTYHSPVASAQVKSAVLLAGLSAQTPIMFSEPVTSRDHTERFFQAMGLDMAVTTEGHLHMAPQQGKVLKGLPGKHWHIPGDISSAAFFLVLGALLPGARLTMPHIGVNPARTGIIAALQAMGANITLSQHSTQAGEPVANLHVIHSGLHGHVSLGAANMPALIDELPVLMVASALMDGTLTVTGAEELRTKESDRLAAMGGAFNQLGIPITLTPDGFTIQGKPHRRITPPVVPLATHHDHRIVMSLAILNALTCPEQPWPIEGKEWVSVSFPTFFDQLTVAIAPFCH